MMRDETKDQTRDQSGDQAADATIAGMEDVAPQHAWAGRFDASPVAALDAINRSIGFDIRLWREDIEGSLAHAEGLARIGILTRDELAAVTRGLHEVGRELASGQFEVRAEDEDIHMAVERRLTELIGDPGRKLHTGRSRNDQVANDVRRFVYRACDMVVGRIDALALRLVDLAEVHAADPLPAYTHMQRGMPTTLGHHLLAYVEMLLRDRDRFEVCATRANVSPLGSGACVGTSIPLDRDGVARALGFDRLSRNSLDAVCDRDFVVDFVYASSMLMMHMSRLGEELVLWSTHEFGFVTMGDGVTTGSSMMPNKKNPDGAELMRGKAGRVFGALAGLLATLKGLPMTYNKDLQEDKEPLFDTYDTVLLTLDMAAAAFSDIAFNTERMRGACSGWVNATDLCEALVRAGEPLRTAHHQTGRLVALAVQQGCELEALPFADVQAIAPLATEDMLRGLDLASILAAKDLYGATSPSRVRAACVEAREQLGSATP